MKQFVKKVIIMLLLLVICCSSISGFDYIVIGSQYRYSYQASLIDKVHRLESIEEPKIILVGHSNVSFGIQSWILESEMGMPVVNLGLHGGLGNAYHEQIAKLGINEGDIVVICHTTFADDDTIGNTPLAWITYDCNNELWPIIRPKDYLDMLKAYPNYLKKVIVLWLLGKGNQDAGGVYSRSAFNKYGDVVYKPSDRQMDVDTFFAETPIPVPEINDICVNRLNEFNEYITDRGAAMVVAGYPIAYGKYAEFAKEDFEKFQVDLDSVLDCDIISNYTDYFYSYDLFYNTALHLTTEGARIRTEQLVSDLKTWQESRKSGS